MTTEMRRATDQKAREILEKLSGLPSLWSLDAVGIIQDACDERSLPDFPKGYHLHSLCQDFVDGPFECILWQSYPWDMHRAKGRTPREAVINTIRKIAA